MSWMTQRALVHFVVGDVVSTGAHVVGNVASRYNIWRDDVVGGILMV